MYVCAKMLSEILTIEQKETRENVSTHTLNAIVNDPNFLQHATCYMNRRFLLMIYTTEAYQSMH